MLPGQTASAIKTARPRVFGGVVDRLTGDIQFVDGRLEAMNIVSEGLRLAESNQVGDAGSLPSFVRRPTSDRGGTVEMRIKDLTAGGFVKLPPDPRFPRYPDD